MCTCIYQDIWHTCIWGRVSPRCKRHEAFCSFSVCLQRDNVTKSITKFKRMRVHKKHLNSVYFFRWHIVSSLRIRYTRYFKRKTSRRKVWHLLIHLNSVTFYIYTKPLYNTIIYTHNPLYNTLHYKMVMNVTQFKDWTQKWIDYFENWL